MLPPDSRLLIGVTSFAWSEHNHAQRIQEYNPAQHAHLTQAYTRLLPTQVWTSYTKVSIGIAWCGCCQSACWMQGSAQPLTRHRNLQKRPVALHPNDWDASPVCLASSFRVSLEAPDGADGTMSPHRKGGALSTIGNLMHQYNCDRSAWGAGTNNPKAKRHLIRSWRVVDFDFS